MCHGILESREANNVVNHETGHMVISTSVLFDGMPADRAILVQADSASQDNCRYRMLQLFCAM